MRARVENVRRIKLREGTRVPAIDNHGRSRIIGYNLRGGGVKRVKRGNLEFSGGRKTELRFIMRESSARLSRASTNR